MSEEKSSKKKTFIGGLKATFKKVTSRKYTKNDLKKLWAVAKDTGSEIAEKPLRETGLLVTAAVVPGAGVAWVVYRLKRYKDRQAANDNSKEAVPAPEKAAKCGKKARKAKGAAPGQ